MRLPVLPTLALVLLSAVATPSSSKAAVTMEPPAIVDTASQNSLIMPVRYWWRGRAWPYRWNGGYYAYRWHGRYYRYRRWQNNVWFYY